MGERLTPSIIDGMRALAMLEAKVGSSKKEDRESDGGLPEFASPMELFFYPCSDRSSEVLKAKHCYIEATFMKCK